MSLQDDKYRGICAVCGSFGSFVREHRTIRETYRCLYCRASLRERLQAQAILRRFGVGETSIVDLTLTARFRSRRILELGTAGPFRQLLCRLPEYRQSDSFDAAHRPGAAEDVRHESLESMAWSDGSFDLVITCDMLEHVRDPNKALAEIARILAPNGFHIFTVPLQRPMKTKSVRRVDTSGPTDVPVLPEHYHGDGKGGRSLVYTDFGADLLDMIRATGLCASFEFGQTESEMANSAATVVSWVPSH
jgi:SAM-dependent methyltransferase